MLDFIADNYLWFIVLGTVLLAIALILLFTRKKPIKEEVDSVQTTTNDALTPEIVEVTGDTEILDIVEDEAEVSVDEVSTFEVLEPANEVKNEMPEEKDLFVFEVQPTESVDEVKNEQLLENTIVEPLTINEEIEPISKVSETSVTEEITFDEPIFQPVEEEKVEPAVLNNDVLVEEDLIIQEDTVNPINVGDVVIPEKSVNTDNVQVNNEVEDIWKF